MAGIVRFGAYVPYHRLGKGTDIWTGGGERAIANFDEDPITMAVAAGLDCLEGIDPDGIDALYFASTTSPFKEKQAATLVAKALDLKDGIFTADFAGSLRAGTTALKAAMDAVRAGTAKKVMVTVADERIPQPRSESDGNFGDGAVAFVVGNDGVVAEIEDIYSLSHEIYDVWRSDGDIFPRSAEDRFVFEEGYCKVMKEACSNIMKRNRLSPKDFSSLVVSAPDGRRHREMGRILGFDEKNQLAPSMFGQIGDTGCAFVPMMLVGALEKAKAGERILVVSYGQGSDALILGTKEGIEKAKNRRGLQKYLASKKILPSYLSYLKWRGLVDVAYGARRPSPKVPGVHAIHREVLQNIALYGVKCLNCGTIQYPIERVCTQCQAKDNFEPHKLSRRASLFTYTMDHVSRTVEPPMVLAVVDFEGGGRGLFLVTDRDTSQLEVGMPLEMSFRKLHVVEGIHNYYWCAVPTRC